MAKKFTTKKLRLRSRAKVRRQKLKVKPQTRGLKASLEQKNLPLIQKLEAELSK